MALTVWTDNVLTALIRHKYTINDSDHMRGDRLQRSGGIKVTVVEGHRTRFFLFPSFTFIFIEVRLILK